MAGLHRTAGLPWRARLPWMAGLGRLRNFPEKDFTGQRDGRTFVDQRTSLNRISLDGRPLLDSSLCWRTWLKGVCWNMWRCPAHCVCSCSCGLGWGGHTQFLERKVFLYGDICVTLYELKCKFLCSETVFCIVIERQGFHGLRWKARFCWRTGLVRGTR